MNDTPDEASNVGASEHIDSASTPADETLSSAQAAEAAQAIEALKAENSDLRDRLLRTAAEMENYRRRVEREKGDLSKYAVSEFARDMVGIGDNLHRAIEAVNKDALDQNPALKTMIEGVEATERELIKAFERYGIVRIDPLGEKFDPHFHEAMIRVDVPNVEANVVVQVLTAGFKIHDRILRPAAVIVAKGDTGVKTRPELQPQDFAPDAPGLYSVAQDEPSAHQQLRRERPQPQEKRPSIVTKPITENSPQAEKDDLISSLGKRLEGGN